MLGYEWGSTHSPDPPQHDHHHDHLILTDHHHHQDHVVVNHHHHHHDPSSASSSSHHHRPIFDDPFSLYNFPPNQQQQQQQQQQFPLYDNDQRAFPGASTYNHPHHHHPNSMSMLNFQDTTTLPGPTGSGYPVLVPKPEPEYANRIGLNLGGRTYFAAADDDLVSRLYRRSRAVEPVNIPKCQAEGCNADLSHAKHYHRRHKVCEFHSKAATVIAAGLTQRFCQQCSREVVQLESRGAFLSGEFYSSMYCAGFLMFHLLSEFDNGKRSCRKRLADHNRRRRKSHQQTAVNRDQRAYSQSENVHDSPSENIQRSPSDSGANSSSSVTVAISSPRVSSFDSSFRQRSYE